MIERKTIDISTGIVFRAILILIGLWFLYFIRDIITLIFIAIVTVSAIDPIITWMQRKRIRRSISVLLIYLLIFIIIGSSVSFLIPPIASQFRDFAQKLPDYSSNIENAFLGVDTFFKTQHIALSTQSILKNLSQMLLNLSDKIFSTTIGIFSGFVAAIVIMVMAFYMAVTENGIKNFIVSIVPQKHKEYASSLTDRIKIKIGRWMLGQVFLMFFIFVMDFIGLTILGVPYALSLALLAGLFEVIPYIGPIVSAIPAIIAGLFVSPLTGLLVVILYIIVQQIESHIVIPQVMKKAVGLHPIAVILALLIGLKLGGILGAILAIPVATAISVFVGDIFEKPATA